MTGAPTSVSEALDALAIVGERLRRIGDPRAAFTDVYAVITRRVRDAIEGPGEPLFQEPEFISRLAGRFCGLYLDALRRSLAGEREPIAAWAASALRGRLDLALPVQHALLGLNAHINFDLAIGLFATVSTLGAHDGGATLARFRHDHEAVNQILDDAFPEVLELLSRRYGCPACRLALAGGERVQNTLRRGAVFVLAEWRSRVWDELVEMLRGADAGAIPRVTARMNRRAGRFARLFAWPLC